MTGRLKRMSTWLILPLALVATAGCDGPAAPRGLESVSSDDQTPTASASDAEALDVTEVSEFAGIPVPDDAIDVAVADIASGEIQESYRLLFTVPDGDPTAICESIGLADLVQTEPFDDGDRRAFALPDDVQAEDVRRCRGMLPGTEVSRSVVLVPRDGAVDVHAVAFLMPR